jgi:hypothetical protein
MMLHHTLNRPFLEIRLSFDAPPDGVSTTERWLAAVVARPFRRSVVLSGIPLCNKGLVPTLLYVATQVVRRTAYRLVTESV